VIEFVLQADKNNKPEFLLKIWSVAAGLAVVWDAAEVGHMPHGLTIKKAVCQLGGSSTQQIGVKLIVSPHAIIIQLENMNHVVL
jgi:hypothetical protein